MAGQREHQVRDGERVLEFNGDLLGESTSRRGSNPRWIEFQLYRTAAGSYVLSRIGRTLVYHDGSCELVPQYRLKQGQVPDDGEPCERCTPTPYGVVYPERVRYWAQVMEQPAAVMEALHKYDESGARYLTLVAQRLLNQASEVDARIASAYRVEIVA